MCLSACLSTRDGFKLPLSHEHEVNTSIVPLVHYTPQEFDCLCTLCPEMSSPQPGVGCSNQFMQDDIEAPITNRKQRQSNCILLSHKIPFADFITFGFVD